MQSLSSIRVVTKMHERKKKYKVDANGVEKVLSKCVFLYGFDWWHSEGKKYRVSHQEARLAHTAIANQ